jgi:hypothetical protein
VIKISTNKREIAEIAIAITAATAAAKEKQYR